MRYIVIRRALKKNCPPGIKSVWSYGKIPSELWSEYERRELEEYVTPDLYTDQMDETIENYSRNFPEYFWEWIIEREEESPSSSVRYDILIDGGTYEGSEELETALGLYSSVDNTCLREYYGHVKSLQATEGDKRITLKQDKIGKPLLSLRIYFQDGSHKDTEERLFPEETVSRFLDADSTATRLEILNSDKEVVLEYNKQ